MAFVEIRKVVPSTLLVVILSGREKLKFKVQRNTIIAFIFIFMSVTCFSVEAQRSSPCHRKCSYVEAFQQANCENSQLESIPIECNAASYLSLRYNHLTKIEPGIFRGFPFLKYLILSNNNISHIDADTFIGAPQLKSIKLLYNDLQTFDRNALNGTENRLRNLYLSRNSLSVIDEGTFQLVPKLEVIDLYRNQITRLTSGVFQQLGNLKRLFCGMNKLVDLPEDVFKDLSSLVYLDLSNNSLSSLRVDLFVHMDHLMTIDLSGNRLVAIGNALNLPNIQLDLRWNNLYQLDNVSVEILTDNMEILFLEGNPWFCNCSLEPLRLWYQQLVISNDDNVKFDNPVCSYPSEQASRKISSLNVSLCEPSRSTLSDVLYNQGKQTDRMVNITEMTAKRNTDLRFEPANEDGISTNKIIIFVFSAIIFVVFDCIIIFLCIKKGLIVKRSGNVGSSQDIEKNDSVNEGTNEMNVLRYSGSNENDSGNSGSIKNYSGNSGSIENDSEGRRLLRNNHLGDSVSIESDDSGHIGSIKSNLKDTNSGFIVNNDLGNNKEVEKNYSRGSGSIESNDSGNNESIETDSEDNDSEESGLLEKIDLGDSGSSSNNNDNNNDNSKDSELEKYVKGSTPKYGKIPSSAMSLRQRSGGKGKTTEKNEKPKGKNLFNLPTTSQDCDIYCEPLKY